MAQASNIKVTRDEVEISHGKLGLAMGVSELCSAVMCEEMGRQQEKQKQRSQTLLPQHLSPACLLFWKTNKAADACDLSCQARSFGPMGMVDKDVIVSMTKKVAKTAKPS